MCIFILQRFWVFNIVLIYVTFNILTYCPSVTTKYSLGKKTTLRTLAAHLDGNPTCTSFAKQLMQVLLLVSGISASHIQHLVIFIPVNPPICQDLLEDLEHILVLFHQTHFLKFFESHSHLLPFSFSTYPTFWLSFFIKMNFYVACKATVTKSYQLYTSPCFAGL